jgi:hypothetical protein
MINIRASLLPSYSDCPRRSATKIIRREILEAGYTINSTPGGVGAYVGIGAHAAAEYYMGSLINKGSPIEKDGTAQAIEKYRSECQKNGVMFDVTTPNNNTAEKQLVQLTSAFYSVIVPHVNPEKIEDNRVVTIRWGYSLSGKSDCETVEPDILDWKFGSKLSNHTEQFGAYSLIKRAHENRRVIALKQYHIPRTPIKKPFPGVTVVPYDPIISERAAQNTIKHIIRDCENFLRTKEPWSFAANTMSMLCSSKYCSVHGTNFCELSCHIPEPVSKTEELL